MGASRKQIAFDLSQEALRQHYPHKETAQDPQFFKRAYKDIQRSMDANGFERRQYSVYASAEKLTALDVAVLTQRMAEQLPWLRQCVKDITATNIGARLVGRYSALLHSFLLSPPQTLRWFAAETPEETGLLRSNAAPAELLPSVLKEICRAAPSGKERRRSSQAR